MSYSVWFHRLSDHHREPVDIAKCRVFEVRRNVLGTSPQLQARFLRTPCGRWLKDLAPDPDATGLLVTGNRGLKEVPESRVRETFQAAGMPVPIELTEEFKASQPVLRIPSPERTRPKRRKKDEAAYLIKAALSSLAEAGKWNASEAEIMQIAGVTSSTYYYVLKNDEEVKRVRDKYQSRRLGQGPSRPSDY